MGLQANRSGKKLGNFFLGVVECFVVCCFAPFPVNGDQPKLVKLECSSVSFFSFTLSTSRAVTKFASFGLLTLI